MTDIEATTERRIRRAVEAGRNGNKNFWLSGIYSADIVGTYGRHATQAIADMEGVNRRTVERRAHAVWMYRAIRSDINVRVAHELRDTLTLSHFSRMWELKEKYDISPSECVGYMREMLRYKTLGESWSVDELEREVEASENWSGKTATFAYYLPRVRTIITGLKAIYETLTIEWREWIDSAPKDAR